jgi:serine/threonine-protein kinase
VINGKWQVDARIGSGGMATVYAATHRNGSRVALKMLHTQLSRDPQLRARFLREGYVANAVGHPGVVAVLDDGETEDGAVFLVLELLEGETIDARRVRLGGALPVDEALDLADEALDALAAAHEKGIVHRDVKPENVFLTRDGRIKLLDFGLARMKNAHAETTQTGVTIGTPEFMPPEQAAGRRDAVDARSDVWGLGATLFTTITGRYVHDDAQSLHEQLIASATRRSRPIRQLAPHVTPAVSLVIDRALELDMVDRWPSARDMQAALRAARERRSDVLSAESITVHAAMPREPDGLGLPQLYRTRELPNVGSRLAQPAPWDGETEVAGDLDVSFEMTQLAPIVALSERVRRTTPPPPPGPPSTMTRILGPPPRVSQLPDLPAETMLRMPDDRAPDRAPVLAATPVPSPFSAVNRTPTVAFHPGPGQSGPRPPVMGREVPMSGAAPVVVPRPRSSMHAVLLVALVLLAICGAMASYVFWRGSFPIPH